MIRINTKRPIEELVGVARGVVRLRLGDIHCMTSILKSAREARPCDLRPFPIAIRRGWVLCVLRTIQENRDLYRAVQTGRL